MTKKDQPGSGGESQDHETSSPAVLSAAAKHAQHALDNAKDIVAQVHLDEVGAKAASAATNLYREGRERLAGNEDLSQATEQLSAAIRKNRSPQLESRSRPVFCSRSSPAVSAMRNAIVEIAQQQAQAAIRRAVVPAAIAVVALVFFLFALIALFAALFFFAEPIYGPRSAALIVAAVAFTLGLIAVLFLVAGRRPKRSPLPPPDTTLPQLVTLLAQTAPSVAPRQAAIAAALLAVALGLMSRGSSTAKK